MCFMRSTKCIQLQTGEELVELGKLCKPGTREGIERMEKGSVDEHAHPQGSKVGSDDHKAPLYGMDNVYLQDSGEDEG